MKALIGSTQRRRKSQSSGMVILALLFLVVVVAGAHAHGGGKPQFLNTPSGPYLLSAWTDPDPWRVDEAHVIVGVSDPATQEPIVADVIVRVRLQSIADPSIVLEQIAGTDNVNRLFYAAEFNDQITEGRWRAFVSASGDMGEGEEIDFEIEAEPARGFNWLWIGIGGMGVFVIGWLLISLRSSPPSKPTSKHRRSSPEVVFSRGNIRNLLRTRLLMTRPSFTKTLFLSWPRCKSAGPRNGGRCGLTSTR